MVALAVADKERLWPCPWSCPWRWPCFEGDDAPLASTSSLPSLPLGNGGSSLSVVPALGVGSGESGMGIGSSSSSDASVSCDALPASGGRESLIVEEGGKRRREGVDV